MLNNMRFFAFSIFALTMLATSMGLYRIQPTSTTSQPLVNVYGNLNVYDFPSDNSQSLIKFQDITTSPNNQPANYNDGLYGSNLDDTVSYDMFNIERTIKRRALFKRMKKKKRSISESKKPNANVDVHVTCNDLHVFELHCKNIAERMSNIKLNEMEIKPENEHSILNDFISGTKTAYATFNQTIDCKLWNRCNYTKSTVFELSKIYLRANKMLDELVDTESEINMNLLQDYANYIEGYAFNIIRYILVNIEECIAIPSLNTNQILSNDKDTFNSSCNYTNTNPLSLKCPQCEPINKFIVQSMEKASNFMYLSDLTMKDTTRAFEDAKMIHKLALNLASDTKCLDVTTNGYYNCQAWNTCNSVDLLVYELFKIYFRSLSEYKKIKKITNTKGNLMSLRANNFIKDFSADSLWVILNKIDECAINNNDADVIEEIKEN